MKIAVIAKTRLPVAEPFRGGLEAFTYTLCEEYIRQGHEITLYAHSDSDATLKLKSYSHHKAREDKDFEQSETEEYEHIIQDIEGSGFDIVHNNSTHPLPISWGSQALIPVVTTLHTPPDLQSVRDMRDAISVKGASQNLRFVAVSKSLASVWNPLIGKDATIIYNGVDMKKWRLVRAANTYVFWYGRMVEQKGLDTALEVAHEVGLPLRFAGSLDDKEYFETNVRPSMRPDDVYLGHLDQSGILLAMHGAAAMINAVRWEEPFGLTIIEAMAAGVPVAGFDRGAFKELINSASGTIAKETSVASLARAVERSMTLKSRDVRRQAERFSLENLVKNYVSYFESLL